MKEKFHPNFCRKKFSTDVNESNIVPSNVRERKWIATDQMVRDVKISIPQYQSESKPEQPLVRRAEENLLEHSHQDQLKSKVGINHRAIQNGAFFEREKISIRFRIEFHKEKS